MERLSVRRARDSTCGAARYAWLVAALLAATSACVHPEEITGAVTRIASGESQGSTSLW